MSPTSSFLCLHFSELPQRLPHLVRTHGQCCNGKEKPLASGICLCGLLEHTPLPKAEGLPPQTPDCHDYEYSTEDGHSYTVSAGSFDISFTRVTLCRSLVSFYPCVLRQDLSLGPEARRTPASSRDPLSSALTAMRLSYKRVRQGL